MTPELEDPTLEPDSARGPPSVFLSSLRDRLRVIHQHLKEESDRVKTQRVDRRNSLANPTRHAGSGVTFKAGDFVWLIYSSAEKAAYIRKHGHGTPWKHRYRVVEVRLPNSVKLSKEDGGPPRIQEWQQLRRVSLSPPALHPEDLPTPTLSPEGVPYLSLQPHRATDPLSLTNDEAGPAADPDGAYEIEGIVRAEKVKNRWYLIVKWKGYSVTTRELSFYRGKHQQRTRCPCKSDRLGRRTRGSGGARSGWRNSTMTKRRQLRQHWLLRLPQPTLRGAAQ